MTFFLLTAIQGYSAKMCGQIAKEIVWKARILENFFVLFANLSIFSIQFVQLTPAISKETSTLPKREAND
jgi:Mn-dependent DtxR family transcriptional regulator